ncbi:MAG: DUF3373 family protein [Campylobacterota bacterium]|nr:DUF3373 family protein [Campylobacterota bacterium]
MNKPLLLSLAAATLLGTNLNAESMYERIQNMELEMNKMREELTTLKAQKPQEEKEEDEKSLASDDDEEESDEDSDSDEESDEEEDEEMDVEEEITDIQETLGDLNRATSGNRLKFGVDYRFAVENMNYEMANGDEAKNDAFMTNRFWMNMQWSATKNLSFKGQLAYNKAFGARSGANMMNAPYDTFDWIANENAYDDVLRLRSAYFLYKDGQFLGADIPWTFSIGRRPSTNGHLINLRDDDQPASPMGHTINVEFDGLSSKFSLEKLTGLDGMYVKFCAGRGMSNAAPKFTTTPYAEVTDANTNIDLIGLIFTPYDNGQYSLNSQYYYANNLIDMTNPMNPMEGFDTVGGMHSFTANLIMNGIGDEWSDFLDDTTFFVSGAMNITDPNDDARMLYNEFNADYTGNVAGQSKTGYSAWAGLQIPSLISEDGRWGLEYNWGSKYWRSITYAEDTNIGSKMATRGTAYEAYFTEYLVEDILSMQIRYTYIDYEYSGSNGFFGGTTGGSMLVEETAGMMVPDGNGGMVDYGSMVVDKAQDIRFYLRYKY